MVSWTIASSPRPKPDRWTSQMFMKVGGAIILVTVIASVPQLPPQIEDKQLVGMLLLTAGVLQMVLAFDLARWAWSTYWGQLGLLYVSAAAPLIEQPWLASRVAGICLAAGFALSGLARLVVTWAGMGEGRRMLELSGVSFGMALAVYACPFEYLTFFLLCGLAFEIGAVQSDKDWVVLRPAGVDQFAGAIDAS